MAKNYTDIMNKDFTVDELTKLAPDEYVVACWHEAGLAIVQLIDEKYSNNTFMEFDDFLNHCVACGGNWGGMLLSGIKELFPDVWELIPDDMGMFAFSVICDTLRLLNIYSTNS
jgi:hypothetical protein